MFFRFLVFIIVLVFTCKTFNYADLIIVKVRLDNYVTGVKASTINAATMLPAVDTAVLGDKLGQKISKKLGIVNYILKRTEEIRKYQAQLDDYS